MENSMEEQNAIAVDITGGWESAYAESQQQTLWAAAPIPFMPQVLQRAKEIGLITVVDLGCGDGRNVIAMAGAGLQCAGMDLSKTALMHAKRSLAGCSLAAHLLEGDITSLPFMDDTVDLVTCFDVFGQLPDPEKIVSEAKRILVPGGLFVFNAFTTGDSEFGTGYQVSERTFHYKGTLFHYFVESELESLLSGWTIDLFEIMSWTDPPHGEFRPYSHRHENWVVFARAPKS